MKNINKFLKLISSALAILLLVSSFALVGCADTGHDDHDHSDDGISDSAVAQMYPDVSLLSYADGYPNILAYNEKDVKKELHSTGVLMLRVAKIDGDQYYCTAGKSQMVNYILINPSLEDVQVDDYLLLSVNTYVITSERFGFDYGNAYGSLYVVFGNESTTSNKITAREAYQIYSQIPTVE